MRRTPLKRKTPLRARTRLKARTPLRAKKPLRKISAKQRRRKAEWRKRTLRLAEHRAKWHCEACGRYVGYVGEFGLGGHHKVFRSQGGPDTDENCLIACQECHDAGHGIPWH